MVQYTPFKFKDHLPRRSRALALGRVPTAALTADLVLPKLDHLHPLIGSSDTDHQPEPVIYFHYFSSLAAQTAGRSLG